MTALSESDLVATSGPLRAWLESLPPDEVAGQREDISECPVARCVRAAGYRTAVVDSSRAYFTERDQEWEGRVCAEALRRFIELVDVAAGPLTAKRCLALLDRAEREVNG